MGTAHDDYAAGTGPAASLIKRTNELRQRHFEQPFATMQSGLNQFIAMRQEDAALATPLLDADDIAIQNAALQVLVDNMNALVAQAEAFLNPAP